MQAREAHNTLTLQRNFPEIYREFFAKCQQVASAPNSFLWSGEFSGFYEGGLLISQKLPFRVYVGFEKTFDSKITVDQGYIAYEMGENNFVKKVFDPQLAEQFKVFLSGQFGQEKDFTGISVHIMTEAPLGHGLGSNGALAAALATLVSKDKDIPKKFELARKILAASQKGYSSGVSAYNALTSTNQPILFFGHDKSFSAYPISEIAGVEGLINWPIDFGLIYTGVQTNSETVVLSTEHTMAELSIAGERVQELLADYSHPPFQQTYLDMLNMTSGLMVSGFAKIFARGSNDEALRDFFGTMNQYQNLLHILNISTKTADIIYRHIHELANKEINGSGSGVKISGIGKGGVMLFALPYGAHRTEIIEMTDSLGKEFNRNINLDYASWLDGIGHEAAKIEQNIEKGEVSSFLSQDVIIVDFLNHGKKSRQIMTKERYSEIVENVDLLIDKPAGRILIAGNALTSKELPSQKATVLILSELLNTTDYLLSSSEISDSYGSNRYDLHSKIVLPLVKQVKNLTKRDLQLSVSGGMYDNFQLKLEPDNISITVSEKKI